MKLYNNKRDCYGCSACKTVCPKQAIFMKRDNEGFMYPVINENCSDCGECSHVCQNNILSEKSFSPKSFVVINKNNHERNRSSSGGVFILLAEEMLRRGGVVCGAVIEVDTLRVKHIVSNQHACIEKMMGSKYVQSDIGDCYAEIKEHLNYGTPVLFSGTPCQIAGCYNAIGKHHLLVTCDVLCHGVPSPRIWEEYTSDLEVVYREKITSIFFRSKKRGWHEFGMEVTFLNNSRYYKSLTEDVFLCGFLRDLYLRPSCYNCMYAKAERIGDITIGDFWGYRNSTAGIKDDDKGLSAVIVSTENGMSAFNSIAPLAKLHQVNIDSIIPGNGPLRSPVPYPQARDLFWSDYLENGFDYVKSKYMAGAKYTGFEGFKRSSFGRILIKTRNKIRRALP